MKLYGNRPDTFAFVEITLCASLVIEGIVLMPNTLTQQFGFTKSAQGIYLLN